MKEEKMRKNMKPEDIAGGRQGTDAVASVVALMLLLAVIATFICLYSTEYLPGLKEQSEIAQVTEVKEAFMDFSNDIERIVSDKKDASYGHTIPLGGGDILMSPEKSSGTLLVKDCGKIFEVWNSSDPEPAACSGMVRVEYKPSYSFWEGQGYNWQYGYINVTKKGIEVPMEYYTMGDVLEDEDGRLSVFAKSFIDFELEERTPGEFNLTVRVVDLVRGEPNFVSGNSATTLSILSRVNESEPMITDNLCFRFANGTKEMHPGFSGPIFEKTNETFNDFNMTCGSTFPRPDVELKRPDISSGWDTITLEMVDNNEITVCIDYVKVTVSPS